MKNRTVIFLVLFLLITIGVNAQKKITLSGVILCEDSIKGPLNFVNVYNKNAKKGTISNTDGKFSIKMGKNDTILFSTIQHEEQVYYFKDGELYHDKSIEVALKQDTVWLEVFSVLGFKEFEEFKQEVIGLTLPANDISLALPVIEKYARRNATGEGQYEIRGPLTYLLKKIKLIDKRKK